MQIDKNIVEAKFIERPNRFQAYVELEKNIEFVHVPNTGRCKEILIPGCKVLLREENGLKRKTKYDLIAAYKNETRLINIDSQVPNKVVEEALHNKNIKALAKYENIEREKTYGNSRFDFKLSSEKYGIYYLEIKGVTFEENNIAMFPDAPTDRGRKHILELIDVKRNGMGAGVLFLVQIQDVRGFSTYDNIDSKFGEAVRLAKGNGVDVMCYDSKVDYNSITINNKIKVTL